MTPLKKLQKVLGLTNRQFAVLANTKEATLQSMCLGRRDTSIQVATRLNWATGVKAESLLSKRGDPIFERTGKPFRAADLEVWRASTKGYEPKFLIQMLEVIMAVAELKDAGDSRGNWQRAISMHLFHQLHQAAVAFELIPLIKANFITSTPLRATIDGLSEQRPQPERFWRTAWVSDEEQVGIYRQQWYYATTSFLDWLREKDGALHKEVRKLMEFEGHKLATRERLRQQKRGPRTVRESVRV